jgi:hypothetical protein
VIVLTSSAVNILLFSFLLNVLKFLTLTYSGGLKRGLYFEFIIIPHAAIAVTIATLHIVK